MNIWLITVGEPSPASGPSARLLRTGLLAKELTSSGHSVTWWASSFDHFSKSYLCKGWSEKDWEGGRLILIPTATRYKKNVSLGRLIHNLEVAYRFFRAAKQRNPPDLIVCSYPTIELSFAARVLAKHWSIPLVIDVRDLWPDLFLRAVPKRLELIGTVLLGPYFLLKKNVLKGASAVVAVSEGYLNWALSGGDRASTQLDRVFHIGYPDRKTRQGISITSQESKRLKVWFVGSFGRSYDLITVVRAARILLEKGRTNIQFVLTGNGETMASVAKEAEGLDSVVFTGWLNGEEIERLGSTVDIGLMAYAKGAAQGLPNKLFEYMALGLPIACSLEGEGGNFVVSQQIGETYPPGDAQALADLLLKWSERPEHRSKMSTQSKNIFLRDYESRGIYRRYVSYLEEIYDARPSRLC